MPLLSLLAFGLFCWLSCATARAAAAPSPASPRIWSGLILATNPAHPAQAPEDLRKIAGKLKNIFGYNQFDLIGQYSEKMDDPSERWLIPSKDFYLSVKTQSGPGGNYPMKIVLFQNRRRLAELETHLGPDSPLFIRGPLYAGGQLVIVLRVADPNETLVLPRETRPPILVTNPSPVFNPAPPREKERPNLPPVFLAKVPREGFTPLPADRFGPFPADRFGPFPADRFGPMPPSRFSPFRPDRFGPMPGERPGDFDSKLGRP
jgi:hypothetical protein